MEPFVETVENRYFQSLGVEFSNLPVTEEHPDDKTVLKRGKGRRAGRHPEP